MDGRDIFSRAPNFAIIQMKFVPLDHKTQTVLSADYFGTLLQYVDCTMMMRGCLPFRIVTGTCDPFAVHYTCNPMRDVWGWALCVTLCQPGSFFVVNYTIGRRQRYWHSLSKWIVGQWFKSSFLWNLYGKSNHWPVVAFGVAFVSNRFWYWICCRVGFQTALSLICFIVLEVICVSEITQTLLAHSIILCIFDLVLGIAISSSSSVMDDFSTFSC